MNFKDYTKPEVEAVLFTSEDSIAASANVNVTFPKDGVSDWD